MATYEQPQVSPPPQVFLNFRGAELRQSFIAHLEMALKRSGVNVYDDGKMIQGVINLVKPIEESRIALVIFSKSYTESRWCLDELVEIKERVEKGKLTAIPVYYEVSPSDVKGLEGDFGLNLWNLGNRTSDFDMLKKWKEALDFVSSRMGFVFKKNRNKESTFIHEIVEAVLTSLDDVFGGRNPDAESNNRVREEKKQEAVSESESESSTTYPKHDQVFINFRRAELRNTFVSHLVDALKMKGVNVFIDDNMSRGGDLQNYFNRIDESKIALVIFSTRYTESAWCLNELVKIKDRMDQGKLDAIPIFYKVEPSQVENLSGVFGENFWNLWRMQRDSHIIKWTEALRYMACKLGFVLNKHGGNESEIITCIVEDVLRRLPQQQREGETPSTKRAKRAESPPTGEKHETYHMEQLEKKLEFDSNDTRIIGVVGMPGIGKTTLAMMLHGKWNRKFLRCVPFLDIRRKSEEHGPAWLRKTLLELLLEGNVPQIGDDTTHGSVKAELLETKFFAILDDVSDKTQLEFLLGGERDWIKKGSKIIITTRDKSLLAGFAHDSYVVPGLNDDEAFQLFKYHAFSDIPTNTFLRLSRMFVDYARGHPLTLILLGKELNGEEADEWLSKLEMVTTQRSSVAFASQLGLSEKQEEVLLDIVHFFKSEDEYFVRSLLDSGDPDSTDDPVSEVKNLLNKFLITTADGRVEINFPLYTFSTDPGSPRWLRLWNFEDIINEPMKMRKIDAENVRGIFLDTSKLEKSICLDMSTFTDMRNLRYMKIYDSCCSRQCKNQDCKLNFPDGLEFPLEEVRYLHWVKFPLEELPPDFRPDNLVDLRLPYSNIRRVWEGKKDTPRLKWVDVSHSNELVDLSALSMAVNLQRLNLEGCTSLEELPVEIQNMKSLVFLNLRGCTSLCYLPEMNLSSLKTLILSDCSNLEEFQLVSKSVEFLHLDGTAIKGLPQAIENLQRLVVLNLKNCKMLQRLPNCLSKLEALDKLILSGCSKLKNLPDVKNSLKHLQVLLFDGTGAKEMPSISCFTASEGPASGDVSLQTLGSHFSVREWPCGVGVVYSLRRLCLSGNDFLSLQPDIWKLYNLKWLDVKQCKKLRSIPMLPPRLEYFDAHGCDSLERVAKPIAFLMLSDQSHATFNFSNCNKLDRDAKDNIVSYIRWRSELVLGELTLCSGGLVSEALIGTCFPGWEVPAWFSHRAYGSLLKTELPPHWCDNRFTGIGLCAVVEFDGYHNQRKSVSLKCSFEFKNEDGSSNRFSCTVGGWGEPNDTPPKPVLSHVFIGFTTRLDINKIGEEDDKEKCVSTKTSIEFEVTDGVEVIKGCEVVKCGFSLVYAPEEKRNICSDLKTF